MTRKRCFPHCDESVNGGQTRSLVVEHFPGMCKDMGSVPSIHKDKSVNKTWKHNSMCFVLGGVQLGGCLGYYTGWDGRK